MRHKNHKKLSSHGSWCCRPAWAPSCVWGHWGSSAWVHPGSGSWAPAGSSAWVQRYRTLLESALPPVGSFPWAHWSISVPAFGLGHWYNFAGEPWSISVCFHSQHFSCYTLHVLSWYRLACRWWSTSPGRMSHMQWSIAAYRMWSTAAHSLSPLLRSTAPHKLCCTAVHSLYCTAAHILWCTAAHRMWSRQSHTQSCILGTSLQGQGSIGLSRLGS